jgi:hypothetical protein
MIEIIIFLINFYIYNLLQQMSSRGRHSFSGHSGSRRSGYGHVPAGDGNMSMSIPALDLAGVGGSPVGSTASNRNVHQQTDIPPHFPDYEGGSGPSVHADFGPSLEPHDPPVEVYALGL